MILQRAARKYLRTGAPWMLARWASTFFESIGAVLDTEAQRVMDGRLAANPYAGAEPNAGKLATGQRIECQPDALPYHRADRGLFAYPSMPILGQRIQCAQWHQLHARRGMHWGELEHARPLFLPGTPPTMHIIHQSGTAGKARWYTLHPDGTRQLRKPNVFNYDDRLTLWTRWWVFIEMAGAGFTGPPLYDDGHLYDDGSVYDGDMTAQMRSDIVAVFRDWKAAHSWLAAVVLVWPPAVFDPSVAPSQDADGRWLQPNGANTWSVMVDPGTGLPTRPLGYEFLLDNPPP